MTSGSANWIVDDSDEEEVSNGRASKPRLGQPQAISSISEFSPHNPVPTADKPSSISLFTADKSPNKVNLESSIVASTAASAPAKPKQPRPRPAYKGPAAGLDSIEQSATIASVSTHVTNESNGQSFSDQLFSLDVAERTKIRPRRHATTDGPQADEQMNGRPSGTHKSPVSTKDKASEIIIDLSSDDEQSRAGPSLSGRTTELNMSAIPSSSLFRVPAAPHAGDRSILPPSDLPSSAVLTTLPPSSIFERNRINPESTPPSSPFEVRKRKKRRLVDDDDFLNDSMDVDVPDSSRLANKKRESSSKRQKTEKKTREKKMTAKMDSAVLSSSTKNDTAAKKRRSKDKGPGQEYKSKEFVADSSEDEMALIPRSSKSAAYSDPASAIVSVLPSRNTCVRPSSHMGPPEPTRASGSVLPSIATSTRPSASGSIPPSADLAAPPPSPSIAIPRTAPKLDKTKNKRTAAESNSATTANEELASLYNHMGSSSSTPAGSDVIVAEPMKKKDVKNKKEKKKAEVRIAANSKKVLDVATTAGCVEPAAREAPSSEISKPKPKKDRKKRATVVCSDDEENQDDNLDPLFTESIDKTNESQGENKENETLPPSKPHPQTPIPPPPVLIPSKPKQRTSKLPPRKDSMSALIRRVSSKVNSPLASPAAGSAYSSPLVKASRGVLSRIAPLHPNRRSPPPAPPRPPAPKKSKKMLELEEKWEMELSESVEGWACISDEERAALRRAKRDAMLGYDD
ncbi:hypothetical protein DFH11DRAFT_1723879 [Phellopilus nigrolimitatus]|nr:hypothetical protein DFH11DRAFT_1723879 [Phellopilus nigrolimitatus]